MKKISEIRTIFPLKCKRDISMPLLYMTFILTSISYLGYWMKAVWNGTYIYYKYYATDLNALSFLRYADDVMFVVLLVYMFLLFPQKKLFLYACTVFVYGVFVLLLNQNFSVSLLAGGIRSFLPAMAMMEWYLTYRDKEVNICFFKNCVHALVVLQAVACLLLLITGDAYRTPGLFGNAGTLGIYCCGAALFYFTYYTFEYDIKWYEYYGIQVVILGITVSADSRSAMIVSLMILVVSIVICIADRLNLSEKIRLIVCCVGILVGFPLFIAFTDMVSPRQNILVTNLNGARMNILNNFFHQDILYVLFGGGLGYGTNSAIIIGASNTLTDGTFNSLLYQFGLIGGGVFILILVYSAIKITRGSGILFRIAFVCGVLLISLNSSLFEFGGFVIFITLCYYMIGHKNQKAI